jgi:enoyl-CoA hydratase/carnithine racemase
MSLQQNQEDQILTLTLNRPKRANSLDPPTIVTLRQAFIDAQSNPEIRVIVLTGAGDRDFTTGIDIKTAAPMGPQAIVNIADTAGDIATLIYFGKPTVVAINGRAMGMGGLFAAAADYRLMHDQAFIRMPEINIPVFPGGTAMAIFARVSGVSWMKRIFLLGEPLSAEESVQANLVDELVPTNQVLEQRTNQVARNLAAKNTVVVKGIKLAASNALDIPYSQVLGLEAELSTFYGWTDEDQKLAGITKEFNLAYQLRGNPDALLKAYQKTQGK